MENSRKLTIDPKQGERVQTHNKNPFLYIYIKSIERYLQTLRPLGGTSVELYHKKVRAGYVHVHN